MENYRSRATFAIIGLLLAAIWVLPNVINTAGKSWLPSKKLNYGLDIQGGLHLVMGVDIAGVVNESANRLANDIKSELTKEGVTVTNIKVINPEAGEIEIGFEGAGAKEKVSKLLESNQYGTVFQKMTESDTSISARYYENYMLDYKNKVIQQSIETIRNRIDEFGVAEPSISQQGSDRILVQLPGMADAERAKALISTAAKLDFMIVSDDKNPQELQTIITDAEKAGNYSLQTLKYSEYVKKLNEDIKSKLPDKTMVLFEKGNNATTMEAGRTPLLVRMDTNLDGGALDEANVTLDNQYGNPQVSLKFNSFGANRFKDVTGNNIGKRMAIVLDKIVKSAPNIQTQIGDGNAVITLGSGRDRNASMDEAKMISTALRAGALPATLEQLEERRVGPTLGSDSIAKARHASLIGALLIVIFMFARYKTSGAIANLALAINIFCMFALLTSLGATLTLPGIAGIALTVGFAVDANVLIFERMREEIQKGNSFVAALKEGYNRALSAILDANITTASTAVVLLYFGTGPIKGFAVTLLIGIVTTMFANVFVSKFMMDTIVHKFGVKKMSI